MTQTAPIFEALKRALRQRGFTYADVAQALSLSEASVKRLFARKDLRTARSSGSSRRACSSSSSSRRSATKASCAS